jgi:integrase/recombinase XerD
MIKVSFYQILSKGKNKNEGPVYMRVKGLGSAINLSTGVNIPSTDWDKKKSIVKSKNSKSYLFNSELKSLESKVWDYIEQKRKKGQQISHIELKNIIRGTEMTQDSILSIFQYFINQHESTLSKGTVMHYKSTKKKVEEFLKVKFYKPDMNLEELNYAFITKFREFLESNFKNHINTINKDICRLKSVINFAVRLEWIKDNPFRSYRSTTVPTVRSTLNISEISQIEHSSIIGVSKNIVKDSFLFMCYTGVSYSDLKRMRPEDVQSTIN